MDARLERHAMSGDSLLAPHQTFGAQDLAPKMRAPADTPPLGPAEPQPDKPLTDPPDGGAAQSPAPPGKPAAQDPPDSTPEKKGFKKWMVFAALGIVALAAIGYFGMTWWTVGRFMISTDDAYVQADVTTLVTKVNGYITKIHVKDNAAVKAGDVLAEIDPVDYELAVQSAKDKITAAQGTIARIAAQIPASEAAVGQADAQLDAQQAALARADADFTRAETLAARDFGSKQTLDAARSARDSARASVENAKAAIAQAQANVGVTKAQQNEQDATLAQMRTNLASAERDLTFTQIKAPADGIIGNRAIDVGSYVTAGTRAMALVPTQTIYVLANFKETQLVDIVPGQEVDLSVDALDDVEIKGHVESIAPASGSTFSLLPVENATGNFTKIVQRVPVRIAISADDVVRAHLRPGLSVLAAIDIRTTPPGTPKPPGE